VQGFDDLKAEREGKIHPEIDRVRTPRPSVYYGDPDHGALAKFLLNYSQGVFAAAAAHQVSHPTAKTGKGSATT